MAVHADKAELPAGKPGLPAGEIEIRTTPEGTVTVDGWVPSLEAHTAAVARAWATAGAQRVEDRLVILLRHQGATTLP
ncbi:MAG: hypothetical protein QOJ25_3400 [Solirubrobacteraceae bacterium]|jgi:osmotically-inducible protein OsmY|nr:hypothetical protein [Solirubrobacteraceae bacterium]